MHGSVTENAEAFHRLESTAVWRGIKEGVFFMLT